MNEKSFSESRGKGKLDFEFIKSEAQDAFMNKRTAMGLICVRRRESFQESEL